MRPLERLRLLSSAAELAREACDLVLASAREAIAERGRFHLALAGGTTPRATYEALARRDDEADSPRWHLWFTDERCVPPDDPASNFRLASTHWFGRLAAPPIVHRLRGEAPAFEEARRYADELCAELGVPPRLDLVLLGLGGDGHTASLFPGTEALRSQDWVTPGRAPVAPFERLTLSLATLNQSRAVVFLVAGTDKSAALATALGVSGRVVVPARRVHPSDGSLLWLVERSAAAALGPDPEAWASPQRRKRS